MIHAFVNVAKCRVTLILGAAVLSLLMTPVTARAEDAATTEKSCHDFVQNFYDWYSKLARKENKQASDEIAITQKKANFSPELCRRLKEDAAAQAKSKDGIVGLDFDPFLNAQDIGERYTAGKVKKKGANYLVEVFGTWNGKKNAKAEITPELSNHSGQWVFENFHYEKNETPESENLLSVLAGLKKDRAKYPQ